jgi:hypothetical protein
MRVLMTGFTTRMVNSQKLKNNYLTCEPLLAKALTELGHEVDHRKVTPGEDLSQYDVALLGICGIQSRTAAAANGTAWAFENVERRLLFCGDWSIEKAGLDFQNALEHWDRYLRFCQSSFNYSAEDGDRIEAMVTSIMTERLPMLAPFFRWGNHEHIVSNTNRRTGKKNLPKTSLLTWDPSPFCHIPEPEKTSDRAPQWIYATLQDHDDWIERAQWSLKWPVVRREKENKVQESELLKEYAASWGILAPPYKTAGSGWWRARFNHAAKLGAVLVCDPRDFAVMGMPYRCSAVDVERMSLGERAGLAQRQRDWFSSNTATREKTLSDLDYALKAAVPSAQPALA